MRRKTGEWTTEWLWMRAQQNQTSSFLLAALRLAHSRHQPQASATLIQAVRTGGVRLEPHDLAVLSPTESDCVMLVDFVVHLPGRLLTAVQHSRKLPAVICIRSAHPEVNKPDMPGELFCFTAALPRFVSLARDEMEVLESIVGSGSAEDFCRRA